MAVSLYIWVSHSEGVGKNGKVITVLYVEVPWAFGHQGAEDRSRIYIFVPMNSIALIVV